MEGHSKNEIEWETSGERSGVEVASQTLGFTKGGVIHINTCHSIFHFPITIFNCLFVCLNC